MRFTTALLLASASFALGGVAHAQASAQATAPAPSQLPRYSAQAFYDTTAFGLAAPAGFGFSADGKSILVRSDKSGVFNAYALPVSGGAPAMLTGSKDNAIFPASYFPKDDRILFTSDQGGNELSHVYVRLADGTVRDLTPGDKVKADFLGWSADGKTFWLTSNERDPKMFDIYAYDAATYAKKPVFQNDGYAVGAISSDGRYVALVKERTSADNNLYLVDLAAGGAPKLLTEHQGNISYGVYDFTPDGKTLVYATNEGGEFNQAWAYDIATGAKKSMIAADWDVMAVSYSPSGRYRVSALNADGSTRLTIQDKNGKVVALKGLPEGDVGAVRFDRDEKRIAFTVASDTSPSDIFVADLATGQARRLTTALNPAIDENQLVEASVARFKSYDGLEVPGILYKPREASAANKVPALVWVHGGPGGQSRRGYSAQIQHLVNNGYAVYAINNRGSSGYGKTFFHLDDKKHGDVDLKDVVASKAFLQGLDWVSDDAIGIVGGSYGGYMVAAALAFEPQVFDAGIDIFGVTNWVRTLESIPPWWASFRESLYDEMGDPKTDAERHRRISPLFHAKNIVKPLLVVQGANDPRVLKVESDELVAAVKANNVPVEYLVFPDEGHGFLRKANRVSASEAYLKFLDTHLKAGS
ncbi:S9 family peptidase [Sphingosinicella sp. LY1275]|uniref:S9 family peptidase n=1 Tax=Sphingosinicella sp. LY1275 TaxID=3095379 RepID=UPI002ADEB551|nr:S9 family peptidase [Sphingosinicella sp. LY1275]MEA1013628.1 S9 family peptidase [Sphingosinicella sp. LY1275]